MQRGAGASIACLADIVVADDTVKLTVAFLNVGLVPDWGLTYTLPRRIGSAAARRLALTRARVDAAEGHRLGIVDILADERGVMEVALEQARVLGASALAISAKAMEMTRAGLRHAGQRQDRGDARHHRGQDEVLPGDRLEEACMRIQRACASLSG